MNVRIIGFFLVLVTSTAGFVSAIILEDNESRFKADDISPPFIATDTEISQNIDEYMRVLTDAGRFSGTVLVAEGDMVLLSKGYGLATQEFSVPNTPQTVFPIGSNTKQFTAAAIMKLQEQGKLNISDTVMMYIPEATNWNDIRIYNLLNHTSGISSEGGFAINDPENFSLSELITRISALPLTFEPGTGYTYSNNGYITLSYIIEKASGMSYEEYLKKNLFEPLGMDSTRQDNARDVFPNRSSGYTTMDGKPIHYDLQNIHNSYGAGSIHSTIEDLFKWEQAFHTPGEILLPDSTDAMFENHYGIEQGMLKNRTIIGHGGRNFGFISYTQYYPDEDVSITFLSNHDRTPMVTLVNDLSAIFFNEPYLLPRKLDLTAIPLTPDELNEYIGIYAPEWEKTWIITVYTDDNRLFYDSVMPKETVELFYKGDDTFFVTPESNDSFIFTRNEDGRINGMKMYTMEGNYDTFNKKT